MNTTDHIAQDDLALFALQLLPEEEAATVLTHLRECALCRKQVAEFQGDLALYSLSAEMHTPPAHAQERLLRSIASEPRVASSAKPAASTSGSGRLPVGNGARVSEMPLPVKRRPRSLFAGYLGWAVAAMFALAAGMQYRKGQELTREVADAQRQFAAVQSNATSSQSAISTLTDPGAMRVTLRQPAGQATGSAPLPEARAAYLPDRGALVFVATHLEPLKPYKVYELWLLPTAAGMSPIPAASFRPDAAGNATVVLPAGPKLVEVKGFGVTQEEDTSAPAKPTLPILLVGTSKS